MTERHHKNRRATPMAALQIRGLHIYYGQSHALQGVDLVLDHGAHAVVGRNGMGKTTLCNAIMGLLPVQRGSIRFQGEEITGLPPYQIASRGIGYTPQGRRLWASLSVEEHLRLSEGGGAWNTARIYEIFPRLFERKRHHASQLSGGEQQMLAISRALLRDPQLLVLDEPTEGLAPVIVAQLEKLLTELVSEHEVAILLVEQNISVATAIAENVAIMANGRIDQIMRGPQLAADRALQQRLLGVGRHPDEPSVSLAASDEAAANGSTPPAAARMPDTATPPSGLVYVPPTRWSSASWTDRHVRSWLTVAAEPARPVGNRAQPLYREPKAPAVLLQDNVVLVAGTFDTKSAELVYVRDRVAAHGLPVRTVDISTSGGASSADIPPHWIAACHPGGSGAVFSGDRGAAVQAMSEAFARWIQEQRQVGGIISAAGSGGTALVTPAMRVLPVGVPKVMISTVASGDVSRYVGAADIMMMYSVTDIQGLNRISTQILANGANALAGMVKAARARRALDSRGKPPKPGLGMTMFGVTTPAVQQITAQLREMYDCVVFHATGTGGQSMEKLVDNGILAAAIDLTTTEVCDLLLGGVLPAHEDRFGAFVRTRIPYIGSVGAVDMVNFGARDSIPERYHGRTFVEHNPQVTLMRTTAEENARVGEWIVARLNRMTGPVRFIIPQGGVSSLDAPDQPFFDPEADQALFDTISRGFQKTASRQLIHSPNHINDPAFCRAVVEAFDEISPPHRSIRYAAL